MNNELEILTHIEKNRNTSQRKIAKRTGLSVGTVNLLLKKMVRKGLIKIERLNAKMLRYIITPHGMAEKTRLAYQYIKISYQQILKVSHALEKVVAEHETLYGKLKEVVLYGPSDEVMEILKMAAGNLGLNYYVILKTNDMYIDLFNVEHLEEGQPKKNLTFPSGKLLVVAWLIDIESDLPENIDFVNIINAL